MWRYRKIDLSQHSARSDDLVLLNSAGAHGWELVKITTNNTTYLKRETAEEDLPLDEPREERSAQPTLESGVVATVTRGSDVKPKYRDPVTGETWSGRGRMATWLKRKQDAGEVLRKYLVE